MTIKEMIDKSNDGNLNLFLLDEIFKGTNTVERISAGKAVLSSLNADNNIVFVSTHDIELADLLKNEYDLYHFSEIVDNKTVDIQDATVDNTDPVKDESVKVEDGAEDQGEEVLTAVQIRDTYKKTMREKGLVAASIYIKDLSQKGKLPKHFKV